MWFFFTHSGKFGVMGEEPSYRQHFSNSHRGGTVIYHRRCRECAHNYRIKRRMDAILQRYPEWTPGTLPTLPLPDSTLHTSGQPMNEPTSIV